MRKYKNSLVFKLTIGTALVMFILFSVLIVSNIYSLYVVKSNSVNSAINANRIYINDMSNRLSNGVGDLNEIISDTDDIVNLRSYSDEIRYFASNRINDILADRINNNKNADGFIVYSSAYNTFLSAYSHRVVGKDKLAISDFVKSELRNKKPTFGGVWSPVKIDNEFYLYKMYSYTDTIVAALIKSETMMSSVDATSSKTQQQFVLTDRQGNAIAKAGERNFKNINYPLPNNKAVVYKLDKQYMMITADLAKSDIKLSTIIKEKSVLLGLNFIQWIIVILGIISIIVMPYIIYYLNKEIIKPINRLIEGTRQIEQGNLDYQVATKENSVEFETLNHSFNSMIKEIKNLKITSYEEKIEIQKAKLKYLQMQIRPHFFLNAITTIHSFTYKNKNEEIRAFIEALSKHLRYMFKGGLIKVSIKEEIEHTKNYIYMQEIKFPNSVFYVFDVDEKIENEKISQFLIQTFVENSFKHAMTLEETLSIFIKIALYKFEGSDAVRIIIEDSGEGFPKSIIDKVNSSEDDEISDGSKVGIFNIKRTLTLLYGKNNLLNISNAEPSGARVEIIIPIGKGD